MLGQDREPVITEKMNAIHLQNLKFEHDILFFKRTLPEEQLDQNINYSASKARLIWGKF